MMVKYILKRMIQHFLFLWYYVRLFRTVNFILFLFSVYSYDIISCSYETNAILVTQSATEQFVQKHSCTSVSHLASNHPLQRRKLSWPSIKPVSLSAISCIDVYAAKRNWRNESRAFTRANIAQRDLWRSPLLFATRHAWSPMEWIFFPVTVLETAIK